MRVLVANKFAFHRGGLERVMFDEMRGLETKGHEVALFSTSHPDNEASPWSSYFCEYLELGAGGGLSAAQKLTAAVRMFGNGDARERFARLVADFRPDIVHLHGIHRQISPSILEVTEGARIPVVQTLHDYHHVCPADTLLYAGESVCDPRRCGRLWYGAAVSARCVRGSLSASALSAAETGWARLTRAYERGVSRFIAPSAAMMRRMRDGGWELPIDIVPNAGPTAQPRTGSGEGFVVIGRVAREKGIPIALQAARQAGVEIEVLGTGPLEAELRERFPEAHFAGHVSAAVAQERMRSARAVVVPSVWEENASMTVLEAMAHGVPVVGSAIGGIPEQVGDGVTGLLVAPGDVGALASALRRLEDDPVLAARLGAAGHEVSAERFSAEAHMRGLLASYERARAGERDA